MLNFVITIHNHGFILRDVIAGIAKCNEAGPVIAVFDGCTDDSEAVTEKAAYDYGLPLIKVYTPDVHETLSINAGLQAVLDRNLDGYVIGLQDDVILDQPDLAECVAKMYETVPRLAYLGFRQASNMAGTPDGLSSMQVDLIESQCGAGHGETLPLGCYALRMVAQRSPSCVPVWLLREQGILNPDFAPYSCDDIEYSLRCLANGYHNAVYAARWKSEYKWGGTRIKNTNTCVVEAVNFRRCRNLHPQFFQGYAIPQEYHGYHTL